MQDFNHLSTLLFNASHLAPRSNLCFAEKIFALRKMFAVQKIFARRFNPHIQLYYHYLDNILFQLKSAKLEQEWADIYKHQYKVDYGEIGFPHNQMIPCYSGREFFIFHRVTDLDQSNPADFLHIINTHYPEVIGLIKIDHPNFDQMSRVTQGYLIYISSHLPSWLKSLNEMQLRAYFLQTVPETTVVESQPTFKFAYRISDEHLHITVEGIKCDQKMTHRKKSDYPNTMIEIQKKPIQEVFQKIADSTYSEKSIVNHNVRLTGMTHAESVELLYIFSNDSHFTLGAVEYFTRHPEKLQDIDYQQLLQTACFGHLFYRKDSSPFEDITQYITRFFNQQMDYSRCQFDLKTLVFIQRMIRYFTHFNINVSQDNERVYLLHLLKHPHLNSYEKSLIYIELAAYLSESDEISLEEVSELLIATAWIAENPLPTRWNDPQTEWEACKALHVHSKAIEELLINKSVPNNFVLNKIYTTVKQTHSPTTWYIAHKKGETPLFISSSGVRYDPFAGKMILINHETSLPTEIREVVFFKELFPHQSLATFLHETLYRFIDPHGHTTLIRKIKLDCVIEQERNGHWFRFIPNYLLINEKGNQKEILSAFESRYINDTCHAWQSIDNPQQIILIEKTTNLALYTAYIVDSAITSVHRLVDRARLGKPSIHFAHFESPTYTQEWYSENDQLIEIQLPRFHLSFRPPVDNITVLECCQYPNWILATNQTISLLGSCDYYLTLMNHVGEKMVLFPEQKLKSKENTAKQSLEPILDREQHLNHSEVVYFEHRVFEIESNRKIRPKSREDAFYLAETLAAHHEYSLAAEYLRQFGEKLSAYSVKEAQYLESILDISQVTGDTSGEQNGIALYAAYLLTTNYVKSMKAQGVISHLYSEYLCRLTNTTSLRLTKYEELRIVKNLLAIHFDMRFFIRLRELDPTYASKISSVKQVNLENSVSYSIMALLKDIKLPPANYPRLTPIIAQNALLTRSEYTIRKYLFEYTRQAMTGTVVQKKWLYSAATFMKSRKELDVRALGILFCELLNHSSKFTIPPLPITIQEHTQTKTQELHQWWTKTLQEMECQLIFTPLSSSVYPYKNITPAYYRVEKEPFFWPVLIFTFNFAAISPLINKHDFNQVFISNPTEKKQNESLEFKNWLTHQGNQISADHDPIQHKEWKRLNNDLDAFLATPIKQTFAFRTCTSAKSIKLMLLQKKFDEHIQQNKLKDSIVKLANHSSLDLHQHLHVQLNKWGGLQKAISLEDVLISFGQKNPQLLQKINPNLDQQHLHEIYSLASHYLQLSLKSQQSVRCFSILSRLEQLKLSTPTAECSELENKLAYLLQTTSHYDPAAHPLYVVFEYFGNLVLRQDQVQKLDAFLNDGTANPIMEIIMGSGKSKVLLPLLGVLRADGKALSMIIVPPPLFENISSDIQDIHQRGFAKSLRTLYFDRHTVFTKRSLEEILDILTEVIEKKECLMMTSKSVKSLLLKFIEHTNHAIETHEFLDEKMTLIKEIIHCLCARGNPLIDEADTVLNVLHELSFSLGRKFSPKQMEVRLIGSIFYILYTDTKLQAIAQLESDPHPNKLAPPLTERLYFDSLQKPLIRTFLTQLEINGLENDQLNTELQKLFSSNLDKQVMIDYLCRNKQKIKAIEHFYQTLSPALKDVFSLLSEEFSRLLPHSLTRISDENYGLDNDVIGIPFSAVNTPSHGSFYSNTYITINFTYQIHFKKGISCETIVKQIKRLKKMADDEVIEYAGKKLISETQGWKFFCILKKDLDIPFHHHLSDDYLSILKKQINCSPSIIRQMIENVFLPQLELFEQKLSCNPIGFTSLFSRISGFTGTLWIAGSMHRKLTPLPAKGTDALTLSLLWNMCKHAHSVISIPKESLEDMLRNISCKKFDLISDTGGYFKEGGTLTIAQKLAVQTNKPVVFFNHAGEQTTTNGLKEIPFSHSKLPEQERLTFLDQSHTTGADIPQHEHAIGLVTIGRNMLLRDLLQSVWRLRGLEKDQKITFVIDKQVEAIIQLKLHLNTYKPITFADILKFVVQNQSKQQGDDNYKAFLQQLWSLPQNVLLKILLATENTTAQLRIDTFKLLKETWIKPAHLSPSALYGSLAVEMPSKIVLQKEGDKCKSFIYSVLEKLPQLKHLLSEVILEIDKLIAATYAIVHPLVITPATSEAETVEVEQSTQTETAVEILAETEQNNEDVDLGYFKGKPIEVNDLIPEFLTLHSKECMNYIFPLHAQMLREPTLYEYAKHFRDIKIAINVLEWKKEESTLNHYYLLGANRTPFHHLHVNNNEVILITKQELNYFDDEYYYNIYLGFKNPATKLTEIAFEKICKLKFLNGDIHYSFKELEFLEKWIIDSGVQKMHALFTQRILNPQLQSSREFTGSSLQKLFNKFSF